MCPPLLKTCSWVIAQFNRLWRQRLTSVAFPCVLTQDAYRRLRNLRRVFLRFGTVFSFRSIRGFISFGKWSIFSPYDERTDVRRFQKYARNNAYTVITVQAEVAQRANNSYPTDKSLSSYSKNWCFKLWKFRQNKYINSRIWCSRSSIGRLILLFASLEK